MPHRLYFAGRVVPLRDVDGRDDLVLRMAFNVSESRLALLELEQHPAELERLVRTDSLTGLLNHRSFFEEVARALERTRRTQEPAALILLDLDRFKRINDAHGHAAGDLVLREVAELLRADLEQVAVPTASGVVRPTASFGVSELRARDPGTLDVYQRADRAMYAAKRAGRNRVVVDVGE